VWIILERKIQNRNGILVDALIIVDALEAEYNARKMSEVRKRQIVTTLNDFNRNLLAADRYKWITPLCWECASICEHKPKPQGEHSTMPSVRWMVNHDQVADVLGIPAGASDAEKTARAQRVLQSASDEVARLEHEFHLTVPSDTRRDEIATQLSNFKAECIGTDDLDWIIPGCDECCDTCEHPTDGIMPVNTQPRLIEYGGQSHFLWSRVSLGDQAKLEMIKSALFQAEPTLEEGQEYDSFKCRLLLRSSELFGTNVERLAGLTGFSIEYVRDFAQYAGHVGLWAGEKVICDHWYEERGEFAFKLDSLVMLGHLERKELESGKYAYRSVHSGFGPS